MFGLGLLALAACDDVATGAVDTESPPLAEPPTAKRVPYTPPSQQSAESKAIERAYVRLQSQKLAKGLLRTGGGGVDTPYEDTDLIRGFERVAFFSEYAPGGGLVGSEKKRDFLAKWSVPIRVELLFGPLVSEKKRKRDRMILERYVRRLERITGHPISMTSGKGNFRVIIVTADSQALSLNKALDIMPVISTANRRFFLDTPRRVHCFVLSAGDLGNPVEITRAVSVIKAENTDLQRQSCLHEEVAQGLGLFNDSAHAYPSIFNDDDEFALLTTYDEEMLRTLYHPSLKAGMNMNESRPTYSKLLAGKSGPF